MKYFAIISILLLLISLTESRRHKKKQNGLFDFIPKISDTIFKLAFDKPDDEIEYEEEHYDEGLNCEHFGGKGRKKHGHHKDKKIIYKPYYISQDYPGHAEYSNHHHTPGYYASSHTTYIPLQDNSYSSHISPNYDHLNSYSYNNHDVDLQQSLYLK